MPEAGRIILRLLRGFLKKENYFHRQRLQNRHSLDSYIAKENMISLCGGKSKPIYFAHLAEYDIKNDED